MEFYPEDPRYALQTFSKESSDYLRHSVLSPKRFGQLEMKLGGYINGLKGSMP